MKKSTLKYDNTSKFIIIAFFIFLLIYLHSITPGIQGDGAEYILQTVSFQNHFTFGINKNDLNEAKVQFYNHQDALERTFNSISAVFDGQKEIYSNHYGAYSVLVSFIKMVLLFFHIYPLWAFSFTNYILWLSAVLVIFFFLKTDSKRKFCILILMIFNPVFFYLDWVHTEVYIFAFEVIGLVFLYNRQHSLSIFALSIASMQNLGVLPLAAAAGLDYILECWEMYRKNSEMYSLKGFLKSYWIKIIFHGVFYIPAFVPIITTYIRFGTYNLVAKVAMENKYLLHKGFDYLFDLNLGIFPYEPFLLIGFIILLAYGLKKFPKKAIINLIGIGGMLFVIAHQIQINSGMQEIMRYCIWMIPAMIFFAVMYYPCEKDNLKGLGAISMIQVLYTWVLISYCVWWGGGYSATQFAPWTKVFMDTIPQFYNPTHGIFYSRATGQESYYSPIPVVYENKEGYARKILLSKEAENVFYSGDWKLFDSEYKEINKNNLPRVTVDEGDYVYINCIDDVKHISKYELGHKIYFCTEGYNADEYVTQGLSFREDWGSWTDGEQLDMKMWMDGEAAQIHANIDIAGPFYQPQKVRILVGGKEVYSEIIEGDQDMSFTFEKPGNGIIDLTILIPNSIAPSEFSESSDQRKLGIALISLELTTDRFQ